MKRNSFVLYSNLKDVLDALTNEQSGILFKAIVDYNNEIEPQIDDAVVKMAFIPIKQALDRNNEEWEEKKQKRSEAGKKGMEKRWGNKDNNAITEDNKNNNVITDDNKNNNVTPKKEKKPKPEKLVYGYNGNVRLTADEYAKLCEKYGDDLANEAISYLDLYILDKGNKYKSHYATIMRWVVDAVIEKRTRQQQKPQNTQNTTNINDYLTQRALGGMV